MDGPVGMGRTPGPAQCKGMSRNLLRLAGLEPKQRARMANRHASFPVGLGAVALGLLTLTGLTGCSSRPPEERAARQTMLVDALPPPNFDGPDLTQSAPPTPPLVSIPLIPPHESDLTGVPREWLPLAQANAWKWIVIHHSATPTGGAAAFDKMHKSKGWDELGYHFVIGNGTDTADGQVEVGPRWKAQKYGAHCRSPEDYYNEHGIGICLVGNFDEGPPSAAQQQSLAKLVRYLCRTYDIPASRVYTHGGVTHQTRCPGSQFDLKALRKSIRN